MSTSESDEAVLNDDNEGTENDEDTTSTRKWRRPGDTD